MSGYSTEQVSALTGASQSHFRQNAYRIKGAKKDGSEWRFPLDGLAEFILLDEKLLRQFEMRLSDQAFPVRYYLSGKMLSERIDKLMQEELEKPIEILTTKDICSLPMGDFFQYSRQVSELCKTKKLFAVKTSSSRFASWQIPTESFAIFLMFHADEEKTFINMCLEWLPYWKERDTKMYKIANSIRHYLNKVPVIFGETYTAQEISDILDLPIREVLSHFFPVSLLGKIRAKIPPLTKESSVSWRTVADYMHNNPDKVEYLYAKWEKLSKQGSDKEGKVRHLLMLYEYYIQNC